MFIRVLLNELSLLCDREAQGLLRKRFALLAGDFVIYLDLSVINGLWLLSRLKYPSKFFTFYSLSSMYLFCLSQKFDICFYVTFFFFGKEFLADDNDSDFTYEMSRIFTLEDCCFCEVITSMEMSLFLLVYFFYLATSVGVKGQSVWSYEVSFSLCYSILLYLFAFHYD